MTSGTARARQYPEDRQFASEAVPDQLALRTLWICDENCVVFPVRIRPVSTVGMPSAVGSDLES